MKCISDSDKGECEMKKVLLTTMIALLLLGFGQVSALPSLTINGVIQDPLRDINDDVSFSFNGGIQEWTLLAEYSEWSEFNNFGYYTEDGAMNQLFSGSASPVVSTGTNIGAGDEIGLWLWVDKNLNGIADINEPYLYSQRLWHETENTRTNDYQYFHVYDVSAYKGLRATYDFRNISQDFSASGDFDYLIYIDDSGVFTTDEDHNDMIIGVTTTSAVPEPGTLLLIGLGLTGLGIIKRRKS